MHLTTEACISSKGVTFTGQDCQSQRFLKRLNKVGEVFCDISRRIDIAASDLARYCFIEDSGSSSSSSSSSDCPTGCATKKIPEFLYFVTVNTLNQDAYDILELLEGEVCDTYRGMKELENKVANVCLSSSSSSSSSSSGISSSSSSSSSFSSSSSSSSSSIMPEPECWPIPIRINSQCEELPDIDGISLDPQTNDDVLYGDCIFRNFLDSSSSSSSSESSSSSSSSSSFSSSSSGSGSSSSSSSSSSHSSSSSTSSSSSSSGYPDPDIEIRYNIVLERWEIWTDNNGIVAARNTLNQHNPTGFYNFLHPDCLGDIIEVI